MRPPLESASKTPTIATIIVPPNETPTRSRRQNFRIISKLERRHRTDRNSMGNDQRPYRRRKRQSHFAGAQCAASIGEPAAADERRLTRRCTPTVRPRAARQQRQLQLEEVISCRDNRSIGTYLHAQRSRSRNNLTRRCAPTVRRCPRCGNSKKANRKWRRSPLLPFQKLRNC